MTSIWRESLGRNFDAALDLLAAALRDCTDDLWESSMWEVPADVLSVEDAVATYFFNSQVLTLPDGTMVMVLQFKFEFRPKSAPLLPLRCLRSGQWYRSEGHSFSWR